MASTVHGGASAEGKAGVRRPHLPFLDGVRALAALYVVVYHAGFYFRTLPTPLPTPFWFGAQAVALFIVLSGYSLALPLAMGRGLKGGTRGFYLRRARRILPPYFAALAICAVLGLTVLSRTTSTIWDDSIPVTPLALLTHVLLVQDVLKGQAHRIDFPMWSVSVETHIYLLFPVIAGALARHRPWLVALGCLAVGTVLQFVLSPTRVFTGSTGVMPVFLGLFGMGCAAAYASAHGGKDLGRRAAMLGAGAAIATWLVYRGYPVLFGTEAEPFIAMDVPFGLACAACLSALGAGHWPRVRQALSSKPLIWLGGMAYSLYLMHAPALQLTWLYVVAPRTHGGPKTGILLVLLGTVSSILVARLFYLVCEKPFVQTSVPGDRKAAP